MVRTLGRTELLHLEVVQEAIELTLFTAYLKGDKPASLLIIAEPESGKTQLMKKYSHHEGISAYDECTAYTLVENENVRMEDGELKHVILYDMQDIMSSKKYYLSQSLRSMMKALMEDGLEYWSKYGQKVYFDTPVNVGFICGSTMSHVKDNRKAWVKDGFATRFIPFSYDFPIDVIKDIFTSIIDGDYISKFESKIVLKFPKKKVRIRISRKHSKKLKKLANECSERYSGVRGFRLLKFFISLAKASALREMKTVVTDTDINRVIRIARYCNYEGNLIHIRKKKRRRRLKE